MLSGSVQLVFNTTPTGQRSPTAFSLRRTALTNSIPYYNKPSRRPRRGAGDRRAEDRRLEVAKKTLQSYFNYLFCPSWSCGNGTGGYF